MRVLVKNYAPISRLRDLMRSMSGIFMGCASDEEIFRRNKPSSGVVLLRIQNDVPSARTECVLSLIKKIGEKLPEKFIVLTEEKYRIRTIKDSNWKKMIIGLIWARVIEYLCHQKLQVEGDIQGEELNSIYGMFTGLFAVFFARLCGRRGLGLISPGEIFSFMHQHISSHERHWLPADNGLLAPHPACRECGIIRNISPDKARKLGYFSNVQAVLIRKN